jgi:protein-tyrosine-phosphatase/predicted ATP-grasp superfamily ATP-dependent carboligase
MAPIWNVLLLGSSEGAGLEVCRSLGQLGHCVTLLRFSEQKSAADHSRFCAESLYLGCPDSGVDGYLLKLKGLLGARHFDCLIPMDNLACTLAHIGYDIISTLTKIVAPNPNAYKTAQNRFEALTLAESAGMAIPETQLLKLSETPPKTQLPCLVKPVFSVDIIKDEPQYFSLRSVDSAEALDAKLRDDLPRTNIMLQAPVTGESVELNLCVLAGVVLGMTVTVRLHEAYKAGGCSYFESREVTPSILTLAQVFTQELRWTGFMTIDCKLQLDKLVFMDIRPYPSDSIALSRFSGVDFPKLLIDSLMGIVRPYIVLSCRTARLRLLRQDFYWLLRQMAGRAGSKAFVAWIGTLRHCLVGHECLAIERLDDPFPAIRQFDTSIRSLVDKISLHLFTIFHPLVSPCSHLMSIHKASVLLVVCKGNINRSIVAECLFRAHGFTQIWSAGLLGMSGRKPSKQAEDFLAERLGLDTSTLRSCSVARALREMDYAVDGVLCFERRQVIELVRRFPVLKGRVTLLSKLAGEPNGFPDIADPHGANAETYLACFNRIAELVDRIAKLATSNAHIADASSLPANEN